MRKRTIKDFFIRLLSRFALLEKTTHFSADLSGDFEGISKDMTEKLGGKDAKNDCFNEQIGFRKMPIDELYDILSA